MANYYDDYSADDLDAQADMWAEEQEFNDMMEDLFYEDEDEIDRKLAEFGLDDVDFDDDDDFDFDEDDEDW